MKELLFKNDKKKVLLYIVIILLMLIIPSVYGKYTCTYTKNLRLVIKKGEPNLLISNVYLGEEECDFVTYDKTSISINNPVFETEGKLSLKIKFVNNTKNRQYYVKTNPIMFDSNNFASYTRDISIIDSSFFIEPNSTVTLTLDIVKKNEEAIPTNMSFQFLFGNTISFDLNGGDGNTPEDLFIDGSSSDYTVLTEIPKRTGYVFTGWYTKKNYTDSSSLMIFDEKQNVSDIHNMQLPEGNFTVYAGWKPITYKINYHYQDFFDKGVIHRQSVNFSKTSYIETDYIFDFAKDFTIKAKFSIPTLGARYLIAGNYGKSGSSHEEFNIEIQNNKLRIYNNGANLFSDTTLEANKVYEFELSYDSSTDFYHLEFMDKTYDRKYTSNYSFDTPFRIGAADYRGAGTFNPITIYNFEVYEGDKPAIILSPYINTSSGVSGLYDEVKKCTYKNEADASAISSSNEPFYISKTVEVEYDQEYSLEEFNEDYLEYSIAGWTNNIDDPTIIYDYDETISNLCEKDGEEIDLYELWKKNITVKFFAPDYGVNIAYPISSETINSIVAPIINDDKLTFKGWVDDNNSILYFDESGEYCGSMPNKDLLLLPIFEFEEYDDYVLMASKEFTNDEKVTTDFKVDFTKDFTIEVDYMINEKARHLICGNYNSGYSFNLEINAANQFRMYFNGTDYLVNGIALGKKNHTVFSWIHEDDSAGFTFTNSDIDGNEISGSKDNLNITAVATSGQCIGITDYRSPGTFKPITIYSFKIYEQGELKYDLMPACSKEEGNYGLLNLVDGKFFKIQ